MKRLFSVLVIVSMMFAVSCCGNNSKKAAKAQAEATEVVEESACAGCPKEGECKGTCEGETAEAPATEEAAPAAEVK